MQKYVYFWKKTIMDDSLRSVQYNCEENLGHPTSRARKSRCSLRTNIFSCPKGSSKDHEVTGGAAGAGGASAVLRKSRKVQLVEL